MKKQQANQRFLQQRSSRSICVFLQEEEQKALRFLEQRRGAEGGDCLRFAVWRRTLGSAFGWLEGGERERSFHREEAGEISVFRPAFSASSSSAQQQCFQQFSAAVADLRFLQQQQTAVRICVSSSSQ